ncbi:MAG TPA: anaerobic sulfatase maturase [Sedimentisphaerales bacterium]|nr:anaerobic sulfatase maturase [Sedimentisphaerales bacterium]
MQPFTLLIKPSGSDCNADCRYCFYKNRNPEFGQGRQRMSDEVLESLIRDYMQLGFPFVGFAWQGGEPTLMGLDFYKRVVELQKRYGGPGQQVSNKLQTNGILLDAEWCRFLHENKFLAGISVDGPKEFHDYYRVDHSGAGTFERVTRGVESCKEYDVEFNTLVLLSNRNVEHPDELFDFFIENGMTYLQFIPCVETDASTGRIADFSITPRQYGEFLCRVFDRWYNYGPQKVNIREFDSILTYYVMGKHTVCTYSEQCAGSVVVEHTGDCFACEFFMEPKWRLGNILETPIGRIAAGGMRRAFARAKRNLGSKCLVCRYLAVCRGGCMKDRVRLGDGRTNQESYFCEGYKRFFEYAVPRFVQLAAAVDAGAADRHTRSSDRIRWRIRK